MILDITKLLYYLIKFYTSIPIHKGSSFTYVTMKFKIHFIQESLGFGLVECLSEALFEREHIHPSELIVLFAFTER